MLGLVDGGGGDSECVEEERGHIGLLKFPNGIIPYFFDLATGPLFKQRNNISFSFEDDVSARLGAYTKNVICICFNIYNFIFINSLATNYLGMYSRKLKLLISLIKEM